jgi:hypothetical protein
MEKQDILLNELKRLNDLLAFLYRDRGHSNLENIAQSMNVPADITSNRLVTLVDGLYVHQPTETGYAITANGKIFWLKGGYVKEHERNKRIEQLEESQITLNQKMAEINEKNLVLTERVFLVNMVIALGTVIAAVYYFLQMFDGGDKKHPCVVVYILAVYTLSIILWAVWQNQIKQRK